MIKVDFEMLCIIMEEELVFYIDYKFVVFMVLGKYFKLVF